jgi:hypothetical protein
MIKALNESLQLTVTKMMGGRGTMHASVPKTRVSANVPNRVWRHPIKMLLVALSFGHTIFFLKGRCPEGRGSLTLNHIVKVLIVTKDPIKKKIHI